MSAARASGRRPVKIRGGNLGWFLCWAVVFADIGTSIYYVPGILYGHYQGLSALFVAMTLILFILLSAKYVEVAWRYPEGGGVVNVSARALHPLVGLLGGMFILVDYYLTAAISALSGVQYLAVVIPALTPAAITVAVTVAALVGLAILNLMGIKESAGASAVFACVAAAGQLLVVMATALTLGPAGIVSSFQQLGQAAHMLGPVTLITGFAAAVLAFSGLETIAQLAPSMREPRRKIATQAMIAVILTMAITSPLLTLWSTTLLHPTSAAEQNQVISLLGAKVWGRLLGDYVAVTGALLLVFASNTAVIGAYHVFIALSRMGFLPRMVEERNRWRGTPHWAVLLAIAVPIPVVVLSSGSTELLGNLYAFGLLGAFVLTCLSLDIVRWHDLREHFGTGRVVFGVGVLTTVLVVIAWITNLVAKPDATLFGGGLTLLGLVIGLATYSRRRPVLFPFQHRPNVPITPLSMARRMQPAEVLAILPRDAGAREAVVNRAVATARDRPLVFLYRSEDPRPARRTDLLEVSDPYLEDKRAQAAFALADRIARKKVRDRRYVYVPATQRREMVGDVWRTVRPRETILAEGDQDVLPPVSLERVRRVRVDGVPILHLVSDRRRKTRPAVGSVSDGPAKP